MTPQLIFSIIALLINFIIGLIVLIRSRKDIVARFFLLIIFSIILWTVSNLFLDFIRNPFIILFAAKSAYIGAILIASSFLYFVLIFPKEDYQISKKVKIFILSCTLILILLAISNFLVKGIEIFSWGVNIIPGLLYPLFMVYFVGFMMASLLILVNKFYIEKGIERLQILYLFIGITLGTIGASLTNLIIPYFTGDFSISTYGPSFAIFFVGFTAFAILKHKLFNIKVIATELLVFAVWVFLLIRTLLAEGWRERIIDGSLLVLVIFFGILIIKSVLKEVSQKEKFEKFNQELERLNDQLRTKTIYLTALQDFTVDITQSLDYKIIIQKIVDEISSRLGYVASLLFMISEDGEKIFMSAISSNQATRIGLRLLPKPASEYFAKMKEDKILLIEAVNKNSIQISDRFSDFISPPVPKMIVDLIQKTVGIKSAIGVPVKSGEKTVGAIAILSNKEKENISQDELEIMQALASQVGIVLKNASLYEQIKIANEKLVEMDKMKAGMYSFVSHQIKAPIGIVKGFAQLISEGAYGKIPKKVKETVDNIKKSADRLIQLVEDFLDLRRIEEGKMDFQFKDVNIVDLVKNIVNELQFLAEQKKLDLSFECKEKDIKVKIDEQRMRQVIQNLIENAIKYTEKGFVNVKIEVKSEKGIGNSILFSVIDSGMGIKPEVLPELFDQFTRAKEARNIKGTGLGLYIAREIVKAHKGEIWAESPGENNGSTFFVKLFV